MCGRFTAAYSPEQLQLEFGLDERPYSDHVIWTPRYNVAPSQDIAVIRVGSAGRVAEPMRWGLVPWWVDAPDAGRRPINARAETADRQPFFRDAFQRRRAIVPVDGWYEWEKTEHGKVPYWIHRTDRRPIALAALWEQWRSGDGETRLRTVAILTCAASPALRGIHSRMPVVLRPDAWEPWLDRGTAPRAAQTFLTPYAGDLEWWPVSRLVNSAANDGADLIEAAPGGPD